MFGGQMEEFIHFLATHWILSTSFFIAVILLILNEIRQQKTVQSQLSAQKIVQLMNQEEVLLVDIRSPEHFQAGHIMGAINIPKNTTKASQTLFINKIQALINPYQQQPIIIIDDTGMSSLKLISKVKQVGFPKAYFLAKGMLAWKAENLPLVKQ